MRNRNTVTIITGIIVLVTVLAACNKEKDIITAEPVDKVKLGKLIFFDANLSNPIGQSCASCHNPDMAFSDSAHRVVSEGAITGLFGNRNSPSIKYALYNPSFYFDDNDSVYVGGLFLDGRVNTLQEQAAKPFMNKLEMNNSSSGMVIEKLKNAAYFSLYKKIYGEITNAESAFINMTDAIATFETSAAFKPFTSKFDSYLKGTVQLSEQESRGLQLFNDPLKGNCAVCHISEPNPDFDKVLFTDFTYDNIGVPKNPSNPFYTIPSTFNPQGANSLDYGLGGILNDPDYYGHFKVPGLRNVALTAPYFHNGFFNTLEEVVHFYNERDVESFPAAEFPATVNHAEMGNLGLTAQEEKDIVAFLKTLTDGYK